MRSRVTAIVALAICLPCVIPLLIAAGIGAGAFSALGAWVSGNALVLAGAALGGLAGGAFGWLVYTRRMRRPMVSRDER